MSEDLEKRLRKIVEAYADVIAPLAKESIVEAADALSALREKLAAAEGERDEARQALEHDRAKVITACNQFNDAFARRSWLLDSRGPYEWDDDRYRDEFRGAYDELAAPMVTLTAIGKDWANCPTNHDEIMRSRQDQKARAEAAEARATAAEAREAELRALLKPFADAAERYTAHWNEQTGDQPGEPDDEKVSFMGWLGDYFDMVTLGDFRAARAALTKEQGDV